MTPRTFSPSSPSLASRARINGRSTARSLYAVEERLAKAERELQIQFTRIAQVQAELDLLLGALRRATDAHVISLSVDSPPSNTGISSVDDLGDRFGLSDGRAVCDLEQRDAGGIRYVR